MTIQYKIKDKNVYKYAKQIQQDWKSYKKRPTVDNENQGRYHNMESTIERLNEVKEFLESKEEDVDKKIEKAKQSAENINKKETRGFITKKQAKEDLENLEDRIDDLKDKVSKKKDDDKKEKKDKEDENED